MVNLDDKKLKELKNTIKLFNEELSDSKKIMEKIEVKVKARRREPE